MARGGAYPAPGCALLTAMRSYLIIDVHGKLLLTNEQARQRWPQLPDPFKWEDLAAILREEEPAELVPGISLTLNGHGVGMPA